MSNESPWVVLKFGGTSVSSRENWDNIIKIITRKRQQGHRVMVVHSALSGISNLLQELAHTFNGDEAEPLIKQCIQRHRQMGQALGVNGDALLGDYFAELKNLSNGLVLIGEAGYRVEARLMALGELMATTLGNAFLRAQDIESSWHDARTLLQSTEQPNAAEKQRLLAAVCSVEADEKLQQTLAQATPVCLTQGFIAGDRSQKTVLLGRGGSDVSGAYFAAKLQAKKLEIWTDVPGLFTANPNEISSARLLKKLTYDEAQEIATNGARVLHPRCLYPAKAHNIPIQVRCTQRPELSGTLITDAGVKGEGLVKTVALRPNIVLVSMESLGMWQQVGFMANIFEVFKECGLSIDLVSTSESNVTVSLDPAFNTHFSDIKASFKEKLQQHCRVQIIEGVSAVSLVGQRIRTILHQLGESFEVFKEHQIYLLSQAANDLNFTVVVPADQAPRLVRQMHAQVISPNGQSESIGATWSELMEEEGEQPPRETPWWQTKRKQLLALAGEHESAYVYDAETLRHNATAVQQLPVDRALYAVKANANPGVMRIFQEQGLGFECVSIGEVERVFELFPDINPDRILFTPNFAHRREYEKGFALGVHVTLDNIFPLQQWPDTFRGQSFLLRIDPGHGQGHHKHVKTGGIHSKFGVPRFEIEEVKALVDDLDATIVGLHAHTGSGIKDPALWKDTAVLLHDVAEMLGTVKIIDVGGGFGIKENENQQRLNMQAVATHLQEFKEACPQYELWTEPGRYFTATAGVLLSHITQLKGKGKVQYVGVATGMNSFIRPALYGASHTIVNLSRLGESATRNVNIVGPICESGDKLGIDRRFPPSSAGDVVCIANTGAYGQVMSSNYNLRPPAPEVLLAD